MKCKGLKERETDYLDGTLGARDRREFFAHLSSCAGCRSRIRELEEMKKALAGLKDPAVPDILLARIERRLAAEKTPDPGVEASRPAPAWKSFARAMAFLSKPGFAASALTSFLLVFTIVFSPGFSKQLNLAPFIMATLMRPSGDAMGAMGPMGPMGNGPASPSEERPRVLLPLYNEYGANKIVYFTESKFAELGQDSFAVLACTDPSGNSSFQGVIDGSRRLFRSSGAFPLYRTPRCVPANQVPAEDLQNVILYVFQRITVSE
jgi:hypothetical protein